jgi:anti-sigma factor RsiW
MNECVYNQELDNFINDQLQPERKQKIENHLISCSNCRAKVEASNKLSWLLQNATQAPEIPDILPELLDKLPSVCQIMQDTDLSAYIDGELSKAAQEGIEAHLQQCKQCNAQLMKLKTTHQLLVRGLNLPTNVDINLWPQVSMHLEEDCKLIAGELSAYLDKEVDGLKHKTITVHLTTCSSCSSEFLRLSSVGDALRTFYQPTISDDFDLTVSIKEKIKVVPFTIRSVDSKWKKNNYTRRVYVIGAAAIVIGLMGLLATRLQDQILVKNISEVGAETYLIDSLLNEMGNTAEAIAYENPE